MLDDVQDSDEDMEDYDEESEEDEGSLYAPSEATSELSIEEEASRDADLVELPLVDPCNLLLLLPRELRDKVRVFSAATIVRAHALMICLRI